VAGGFLRLHQGGETGAVGRSVAGGDQHVGGAGEAAGDIGHRQAEIGGADHLALVHRDAAEDLRQILSEADADDEFLHLAEGARRGQTLGIGGELPDALHIGGQPGEAVGGALLALDGGVGDAPALGHQGAHRGHRLRQHGIHRDHGALGEIDQGGRCILHGKRRAHGGFLGSDCRCCIAKYRSGGGMQPNK
jgi:hypothetical protein